MKQLKIIIIFITVICLLAGCTAETEKEPPHGRLVYITPTGEKYHYRDTCAGKNAKPAYTSQVINDYGPCKKCVH